MTKNVLDAKTKGYARRRYSEPDSCAISPVRGGDGQWNHGRAQKQFRTGAAECNVPSRGQASQRTTGRSIFPDPEEGSSHMLRNPRSKAPPDSRQIGTLCFTGAKGQRVSVWQLQRNQMRAAKAKLPYTVHCSLVLGRTEKLHPRLCKSSGNRPHFGR